MSFKIEVFDEKEYAARAAETIAEALPREGSVVLTGGSTAKKVYPELARAGADWSGLAVYFSDERSVPPNHDESNYRMVRETLLDAVEPREVNRVGGELHPGEAADDYHLRLAPAVERGLDVVLLGMGADCHVCAMFPGSRALQVTTSLAVAVDRPDGMTGVTMTPPALRGAEKVLLIVTGAGKAEALARTIKGDEDLMRCPARLLVHHADATFLLDAPAASQL